MKTKLQLVFSFAILSFLTQCQTAECFTNPRARNMQLILHPEGIYQFSMIRYFDIGGILDSIYHEGSWEKMGDTLVLNSYNRPDNFEDIEVEEKHLKNTDSLRIIIGSRVENLLLGELSLIEIRVNDHYYKLEYFPTQEKIDFKIPMPEELKYIVVPGYPVYEPENSQSNHFEIRIAPITSITELFPKYTYFLNKPFLLKEKKLFERKNNTIDTTRVYIECQD